MLIVVLSNESKYIDTKRPIWIQILMCKCMQTHTDFENAQPTCRSHLQSRMLHYIITCTAKLNESCKSYTRCKSFTSNTLRTSSVVSSPSQRWNRCTLWGPAVSEEPKVGVCETLNRAILFNMYHFSQTDVSHYTKPCIDLINCPSILKGWPCFYSPSLSLSSAPSLSLSAL